MFSSFNHSIKKQSSRNHLSTIKRILALKHERKSQYLISIGRYADGLLKLHQLNLKIYRNIENSNL